MRLDRHPILLQAYDVCQAIEDCGASEELTHAVILAGELMDSIDALLDENESLLKKETYYYYTYTRRNKKYCSISYCDGVCKGDIAKEISELKKCGLEDKYYSAYVVTFYKEITKDEYKTLNGYVG